MSKAKDLLMMINEDAVSDFIKALGVKTERSTTGREKIPTIQVFGPKEEFTVDYIKGKGFFWMDFNKEELLGKDPQSAAKKLKTLL